MNSAGKRKDVIVTGGGPAGIVAAIAAARNGVDTLLIEQSNCLGGIATSGFLSVWGPFDDADRRLDWERFKKIAKGIPLSKEMRIGRRIIKGIPEEILNRLIKLRGAVRRKYGFIPLNPEILKYVADQIVIEAGVRVLFHTQVVDSIVEKKKIIGVVVANKSGLQNIYGRIIVDATGDGDIADRASVPFKKGRNSDGQMQGVTMVFRLGGVTTDKMHFYDTETKNKYNKLFHREGSNLNVGCVTFIPGMQDAISINSQHTFSIDGTNPENVTKATIEGRRQVRKLANLFKKHVKGCENSYLLDTAMQVGIRETRRIVGEYVLTKEDILGARKFKDSIGKNAYNIDIHLPDENFEVNQDIFLKTGTSYDIPYRCLIPKKIENLLVAGRCISATHEAQSSIRIMPCCMVTGQAAGTAAALSIKEKKKPRDLDISLLRETLKKQNVYLGQ